MAQFLFTTLRCAVCFLLQRMLLNCTWRSGCLRVSSWLAQVRIIPAPNPKKSRWCTVNSSSNLMLNVCYTILPIQNFALSQIFPLFHVLKQHGWQHFLFLVILLACSSSGLQHPFPSENPSAYKRFYTDRIVVYEEIICVLQISIAITRWQTIWYYISALSYA